MFFFTKLIGLVLMIMGIYFLGNNIVLYGGSYHYGWNGIAANAAVLCLIGGVFSLMLLPRKAKSTGWLLIGLGIISVFVSGFLFLNPITLWQFLGSLVMLILGFKLYQNGSWS
jgi:hypothetical protein